MINPIIYMMNAQHMVNTTNMRTMHNNHTYLNGYEYNEYDYMEKSNNQGKKIKKIFFFIDIAVALFIYFGFFCTITYRDTVKLEYASENFEMTTIYANKGIEEEVPNENVETLKVVKIDGETGKKIEPGVTFGTLELNRILYKGEEINNKLPDEKNGDLNINSDENGYVEVVIERHLFGPERYSIVGI